jgi:plastocyanin
MEVSDMDIRKIAVGLIVAVTLVGCGSGNDSGNSNSPSAVVSSGSAVEPLSGMATITIDDFATAPRTLFVKKGTVITVTNNDITGHSLTADNGSFDSGVLGKGKSATVTLNTVGTVKFHCSPHSTTKALQGTITVVE